MLTDYIFTETNDRSNETKVWAAIKHSKSKSYLLALRAPHVGRPNTYAMFGGNVDPGHTSNIAIILELYEEGRLNLPMLLSSVYVLGSGMTVKYFTTTTIQKVKPKLDKSHTSYGWFTEEEIANLPLHPYTELYFRHIIL